MRHLLLGLVCMYFALSSPHSCQAATADFNGDGKSDVVWRQSSTGAVVVWLMNGSEIETNSLVATPGLEWQIATVGDFNGDGKSDVVWRQSSTGAVVVWLMNGSEIETNSLVATPGLEWQIVTVAQLPLLISRGFLDFGIVTIQTDSGVQSFTVTNTGNRTLTGTATTSAPFSIVSGGSFNLGATQSQAVRVRFHPTGIGSVNNIVVNVNTNGVGANGGLAQVSVTGTGVPPPPHLAVIGGPLNFGNVTVNTDSGIQFFTVLNDGGGVLTGNAATNAPFGIVAGGSINLGAGQSQPVWVLFHPTVAGGANSSVNVNTNGGSTQVSESGTGLPPPCTLDTWNNHMASWFSTTCASCHVPEGFHSTGTYNWTDYQNVKNHLGTTNNPGRILIRVNAHTMPPGDGLSQSDIDRLNLWANCGAPQ